MRKIYLFIGVIISLLYSCEKFDKKEEIPSFISIDKVDFSTTVGQGTDSVVISDVWVYVDDESIGAYQLPAIIPVLHKGTHLITIKPGIVLNGIAATRSINPFFTPYSKSVTLFEDSVVKINPTSTYHSNTKFIWNDNGEEGFEDGGISIDSIFPSKCKISKTSTEVFEGTYSGLIHLTKDTNYFIGASSKYFPIPTNGSKSNLLELHIKNPDTHLGIGVYINFSSGMVQKVDYLTINPGTKWKKIYVNMSNLLDKYMTGSTYRIFLSSSLPANKTESNIYLDNIKLVTF
jgi:hypothetical protein